MPMPSPATKPDRAPRASVAWAGWRATILLTLALLGARIIYHVFLSPYALAADEAHYWDWSRHPSLSYYSKGPGVAWVIRASTGLFGHAEWAVRLPSMIASALTMLAIARLGQRCAGGDARAAFLSAATFCLVPAFLATSMLMTIDMPYVACWALAALAAWELFARQDAGRAGLGWAAALGIAIGAGFLFKYTILLLLPGLLLYRLLRPARVSLGRALGASVLCAGLATLVAQPVLVWNHQHGWPTVTHLLGHLGLEAGDVPRDPGEQRPWSPLWLLAFVGAQFGIVGPVVAPMLAAAIGSLRRAGRAARADLFLASCAAPIIVVYLGVSLIIEPEANWPIAGYVTLCALVGARAAPELARHRALVEAWRALDRPRPRRGIFRRRPETWWQITWHWSIGYALVAGIGMLMFPLLERVPLLADVVPTHRIMGHPERSARLAESLRDVHADQTGAALVMAHRYTDASWTAYSLFHAMGDDAPTVTSASAYLGDRESAYDYWESTDPADPRWLGTTIHLVGARSAKWERGFIFERIVTLDDDASILIGFGYGGPREDATR